jgi:hypothetical protein
VWTPAGSFARALPLVFGGPGERERLCHQALFELRRLAGGKVGEAGSRTIET